MSTTALANSLLYDSEEGVGIEVNNPTQEGIAPLNIIDSEPSNVLGGKLWTSWKNGHSFRANYDHSSKTHRCTAQNGDGTSSRSAWEPKGVTARSNFVPQTIMLNRCYAKTK